MATITFTTSDGVPVVVTWVPGGPIDGPADLLAVAGQLAADGVNVSFPTFAPIRASLDTTGPTDHVQLTLYKAGDKLGWSVVDLDPPLPAVDYDDTPGIVY